MPQISLQEEEKEYSNLESENKFNQIKNILLKSIEKNQEKIKEIIFFKNECDQFYNLILEKINQSINNLENIKNNKEELSNKDYNLNVNNFNLKELINCILDKKNEINTDYDQFIDHYFNGYNGYFQKSLNKKSPEEANSFLNNEKNKILSIKNDDQAIDSLFQIFNNLNFSFLQLSPYNKNESIESILFKLKLNYQIFDKISNLKKEDLVCENYNDPIFLLTRRVKGINITFIFNNFSFTPYKIVILNDSNFRSYDDICSNRLEENYKKFINKDKKNENKKIIDFLNLIFNLIKKNSDYSVSEEEAVAAEDIYKKILPTQTNPKNIKNLEKNFQKIIEKYNKTKFSKEIGLLKNYKQLVLKKISQQNNNENIKNAMYEYILNILTGGGGDLSIGAVGDNLVINYLTQEEKDQGYMSDFFLYKTMESIADDIKELIPEVIKKIPVIENLLDYNNLSSWELYDFNSTETLLSSKKIRDNDGKLTDSGKDIYKFFYGQAADKKTNSSLMTREDGIKIIRDKIFFNRAAIEKSERSNGDIEEYNEEYSEYGGFYKCKYYSAANVYDDTYNIINYDFYYDISDSLRNLIIQNIIYYLNSQFDKKIIISNYKDANSIENLVSNRIKKIKDYISAEGDPENIDKLNNQILNQKLGDSPEFIAKFNQNEKINLEKNAEKIKNEEKIIQILSKWMTNNPDSKVSQYIKIILLGERRSIVISYFLKLFNYKVINEGDVSSLLANEEKFINLLFNLKELSIGSRSVDEELIFSAINKDSMDTSIGKINVLNKVLHDNFTMSDSDKLYQSINFLYKNINIKNINLNIIQKLFKIFSVICIYNFNFDEFYDNNKKLFTFYKQDKEKVKNDFEYFASLLRDNKPVNSIKPEVRERIISVSANLISLKDQKTFDVIKSITREEKIPEIYQLNKNFDKFRFVVHDDMKFLLTEVGDITNCCQKIGGAGQSCAIDSWANSHAAVVVLEFFIKNEWKIVSQSYFHYVTKDQDPNGPGVILDNVESIIGMQFSPLLDKAYLEYAQYLKNNLNLKYLYCGKTYSDLKIESFKTVDIKNDPRKFVVNDYLDFNSSDCMDLSQPTFGKDRGEGKEKGDFKFKFLNASNNNYFIKIASLYLEVMTLINT